MKLHTSLRLFLSKLLIMGKTDVLPEFFIFNVDIYLPAHNIKKKKITQSLFTKKN